VDKIARTVHPRGHDASAILPTRMHRAARSAHPADLPGRRARRADGKTEAEWAERASIFLKRKLKEGEITYVELAKRLKKHGFKETQASITNKLKRGTFSATFMLACIAAMELEGVVLSEI
jgi:hypothetical protein